MAHVIASLRPSITPQPATTVVRRVAIRQQQVAAAQPAASPKTSTAAQPVASPSTDFKAVLTTTATTQPQAAPPATAPPINQGPDWRDLFRGAQTGVPAVPEKPAPAAPTAESVFGASPWMSNPTGMGPNGQPFSYNKFYFASEETAAKVAQIAGGTVVKTNMFTPSGGGGFAQQQPNYMVQMSDGRLINPGLVASFYTHGYSQSYVDQMVAAELRST